MDITSLLTISAKSLAEQLDVSEIAIIEAMMTCMNLESLPVPEHENSEALLVKQSKVLKALKFPVSQGEEELLEKCWVIYILTI